jgi:hypothetical protein
LTLLLALRILPMTVAKLPRRVVQQLKALDLAYEENGVLFPTALGVIMKSA